MKKKNKRLITIGLSVLIFSLFLSFTAYAKDYSEYLTAQEKSECEWIKKVRHYVLEYSCYYDFTDISVALAEEDLIVFDIAKNTTKDSLFHMSFSINSLFNPYGSGNSLKKPDAMIVLADMKSPFSTFAYKLYNYPGRVVRLESSIERNKKNNRFIHFFWSIEGKEACNRFRKEVLARKNANLKERIDISYNGTYVNSSGTEETYSDDDWASISGLYDKILNSGGIGDELSVITQNGRITPEAGVSFQLPQYELSGFSHTAYSVTGIY